MVVVLIVFLLLSTTVLVTFGGLRGRINGKRKKYNLPQGDMGWPLVGKTFSFIKPHPSTTVGDFIQQHVSRFGKIFMSNLLGKPTVVSTDAELNRFILQNDLRLFEPGWSKSVSKILGKHSILLQVGETHKHMRSLNLSFWKNENLRSLFIRDADRMATMLLGLWRHNSVVSAKYEARKLTFYLMVKNVLGMTPGTPETEKLRTEFEKFANGVVSLPLNWPGTAYKKALQSRLYILKVIQQSVEERNHRKKAGGGEEIEDDFLQWVLDHSTYLNEELGDLVVGTFLGGHNTTSKAIALAIYFLGGCPKAVKHLREEHDAIIRSKRQGETELNWEDYKKMGFTQCVISEALRLGNITKFVQRKASSDVQFKGYDIPKGCNVMAVLASVHLDPLLYEDPDKFNPWRWQTDSGIKRTNNFMAFGGGVRLCPGVELGRMEIAVFLHHLVMKYKWELAEPDQPIASPAIDFPKGLPIKVQVVS